MIQRLNSDNNRIVWINSEHIGTMEVISGVADHFAKTRIIFRNGGSEMVHEHPDDIMKFINKSA